MRNLGVSVKDILYKLQCVLFVVSPQYVVEKKSSKVSMKYHIALLTLLNQRS